MTSRWRHCHGNFTLVHTIYICSAFFHCEQVAIRWIILFSASGIHAPLRPWERPACYLFQCSFSYVLTKKRHSRRFFDRLYDTLDMSVWIEKLTNRWPPIKINQSKFSVLYDVGSFIGRFIFWKCVIRTATNSINSKNTRHRFKTWWLWITWQIRVFHYYVIQIT